MLAFEPRPAYTVPGKASRPQPCPLPLPVRTCWQSCRPCMCLRRGSCRSAGASALGSHRRVRAYAPNLLACQLVCQSKCACPAVLSPAGS